MANFRHVFTASIEGTIIKWSTHKHVHVVEKIHFDNLRNLRAMKMFNDKLVLGNNTCVCLYDFT